MNYYWDALDLIWNDAQVSKFKLVKKSHYKWSRNRTKIIGLKFLMIINLSHLL